MKRRCRKCGTWIRRCPVATDLERGLDVEGWCSASIPGAVCPVVDSRAGQSHLPELLF